MEFLQELFGDEALNYDALAERVRGAGMKLADLSGGGYVGAEKHRAALEKARGEGQAEQQALRLALETAQLAAGEAQAGLERAEYGAAVREAAAGQAFTSLSARAAFAAELEHSGLALDEGGRLEGLDAFVEAYREKDPEAFCPAAPAPMIVTGGSGGGGQLGWRESLERNLRRAGR